MQKNSRILVVLLLIANLIVCTGCNVTKTGNQKDSSKTSEASGEAIKMITWANDGTIEALNKVNEQFYEKTGIEVELSYVDSPDYEEYLKEKIAANDVDIFCYTSDSKAFAQPVVDWAPSEMLTWEEIIDSGNAMDISGYDFINNWTTGADACRYKDGIYGIATGMTIMNGMFYNKAMFEENGWSEPKTWKEFISLCEEIKAKGITPITVGGADTWPVQMLTNAVVDSVVEGESEDLTKGLWTGSRKFTDETSMEIYNREYQILSYMEDNYLNVKYDEAPAHFAEGNIAMFYSGSWNSFEIEQANPDFDYDYFAIPGDTKHNFTGKYDLTFGINAKSNKTELAVKWLEYFSTPDVYTTYIDCNGFIPTMSWISTSNSFLIKIDDKLKDANRTYECYNRIPTNNKPYGTYDLINYSIAGGVFDTPEQFAEAAQKDWEESISRK